MSAAKNPAEAIERLRRASTIMRGAIKRNTPDGPLRNAAMVQLGAMLEIAIEAARTSTKDQLA